MKKLRQKERLADEKVFVEPVRGSIGRRLPSRSGENGKVQVEMVMRVDDDDAQQGQRPENVKNGDPGRGSWGPGGTPGCH